MDNLMNQMDMAVLILWLSIALAAALLLYKLYKIIFDKHGFTDFFLIFLAGGYLVYLYQGGFDYLNSYLHQFLQ